MSTPETIVALTQIWLIVGALVAALFLTIGIDRIDEDAEGAYVFRPLLIPGVLLIWPLVLWRWWVLETARDSWRRRYTPPLKSHLIVSVALLFVVAATIVASLAVRQPWPSDIAPAQLSQPEASQ